MPPEYMNLIGKKFISTNGNLLFVVNGISFYLGKWVVATGFKFHVYAADLLDEKRFKELV